MSYENEFIWPMRTIVSYVQERFNEALEDIVAARISYIEGGRLPSMKEITEHGKRVCFPQGLNGDHVISELFVWRGVPIVRVERKPDGEFGYVIIELTPDQGKLQVNSAWISAGREANVEFAFAPGCLDKLPK